MNSEREREREFPCEKVWFFSDEKEGNMNLKLCNAREQDEDDGIYRRGFERDLLNWICGWGLSRP